MSTTMTFQSVVSSCSEVSVSESYSECGYTYINHGQATQNLDLLDLSDVARATNVSPTVNEKGSCCELTQER